MSDEFISRQAAIDAINSHFGFNIEEEYGSAVQEVINGLPAADVVPVVHGRWIPYRCDMYECSVCQRIHTSMDVEGCDAEYCPHCGAKMRGEVK